MKILVTGANGYLGRGVVKQLLDEGVTVIATDFNTEGIDERARRIACDLFEVEDPFNFFEQPDSILHMAWRDGFIHNSNTHIHDLPQHHSFLLKLFQSEIKKIAVMGTMHEIGFWEGSIDEFSPTRPMNLYGIAKNTLRYDVEYMANTFKKDYQWLRAYYIVGDSAYGSSIFSKLYYSATIEGKKEFPFTLGINQFDFIDYDEFCLRTALAIKQNDINGIINICTGRPEKLADRVERFISDNNLNIKLRYGDFPDRVYDSKAVWGNSTKIETILLNNKLDS